MLASLSYGCTFFTWSLFVEVGENCIKVSLPATISSELAYSLVALALDEKLVAVGLCKVDASCFRRVLHVKENLGTAVFDHLGEDVERRHGQGGAHDQA